MQTGSRSNPAAGRCTRPSPAAAATPVLTSAVRCSGDWLCTACKTTNFQSRSQCFMCARDRSSASANPVVSSSTETTARQEVDLDPADMVSIVDGGDAVTKSGSRNAKRPGDWVCPACFINNFASRAVCFKCAVPRPADAGSPSAGNTATNSRTSNGGGGGGASRTPNMAGDWICSSCQSHNFRGRDSCRQCKGLKSEVGKVLSVTDVLMPGDWRCAGCGNHNFRKRDACFTCSAPRPPKAEGATDDTAARHAL